METDEGDGDVAKAGAKARGSKAAPAPKYHGSVGAAMAAVKGGAGAGQGPSHQSVTFQ